MSDAERPAFTLPNSWTQSLQSPYGAHYQISVAMPKEPAPEEGFPVIYLLDANASFATVVETHRRLSRRPDATGVGPAIIVGIGHDTQKLYDTALRQRDFTPARPAADQAPRGGAGQAAADNNSGAAEFLAFIQTQVQPLIQQEFAVAADRQVLAGHSLAAFFTLWVLASQPAAFHGYIALSPSLWWDTGLLDQLATLPSESANRRVYLAVGEWEEALAPWQLGQPGSAEILQRRQQRRMVSNVHKCAEVLAARLTNGQLQCQTFDDEDHASIFAVGISKGMRMML